MTARGRGPQAVGGAGALLSGRITRAEVVAYEDLGTEAIRLLELDGFPAIVACDAAGGDLFSEGKAAWRRPDVLGGFSPDYSRMPGRGRSTRHGR